MIILFTVISLDNQTWVLEVIKNKSCVLPFKCETFKLPAFAFHFLSYTHTSHPVKNLLFQMGFLFLVTVAMVNGLRFVFKKNKRRSSPLLKRAENYNFKTFSAFLQAGKHSFVLTVYTK